MLAPADFCVLYEELCLFVCVPPVKKLHSAPVMYDHWTSLLGKKNLDKRSWQPPLRSKCMEDWGYQC